MKATPSHDPTEDPVGAHSLLNPNSPQVIVAEIELSRKLVHANICKLHEVFESRSKIIIVMDLVAGGPLLMEPSEFESFVALDRQRAVILDIL